MLCPFNFVSVHFISYPGINYSYIHIYWGYTWTSHVGFRREKGTTDATGMLRIMSEWTMDINKELCDCFVDWKKALEPVSGPN